MTLMGVSTTIVCLALSALRASPHEGQDRKALTVEYRKGGKPVQFSSKFAQHSEFVLKDFERYMSYGVSRAKLREITRNMWLRVVDPSYPHPVSTKVSKLAESDQVFLERARQLQRTRDECLRSFGITNPTLLLRQEIFSQGLGAIGSCRTGGYKGQAQVINETDRAKFYAALLNDLTSLMCATSSIYLCRIGRAVEAEEQMKFYYASGYLRSATNGGKFTRHAWLRVDLTGDRNGKIIRMIDSHGALAPPEQVTRNKGFLSGRIGYFEQWDISGAEGFWATHFPSASDDSIPELAAPVAERTRYLNMSFEQWKSTDISYLKDCFAIP